MRVGSNFSWLRGLSLVLVASVAFAAALAWAGDPPKPTSIFDDNAPDAPKDKPTTPPTPRAAATQPSAAPSAIVADSILIVADDFVTDIYLNGQRVPDGSCKLEGEIYGATVLRVTVDVHPGDSLVFNAANDRFRWGGSTGLSVAGMMGDSRTPAFVSEAQSGNWSGCSSLEEAPQFIEDPMYLHEKPAVVPDKPWKGCTDQMAKRCDWTGETLWASGDRRNVWIRYVAPR
jgi:hypothetical protein